VHFNCHNQELVPFGPAGVRTFIEALLIAGTSAEDALAASFCLCRFALLPSFQFKAGCAFLEGSTLVSVSLALGCHLPSASALLCCSTIPQQTRTQAPPLLKESHPTPLHSEYGKTPAGDMHQLLAHLFLNPHAPPRRPLPLSRIYESGKPPAGDVLKLLGGAAGGVQALVAMLGLPFCSGSEAAAKLLGALAQNIAGLAAKIAHHGELRCSPPAASTAAKLLFRPSHQMCHRSLNVFSSGAHILLHLALAAPGRETLPAAPSGVHSLIVHPAHCQVLAFFWMQTPRPTKTRRRHGGAAAPPRRSPSPRSSPPRPHRGATLQWHPLSCSQNVLKEAGPLPVECSPQRVAVDLHVCRQHRGWQPASRQHTRCFWQGTMTVYLTPGQGTGAGGRGRGPPVRHATSR